MYFSLIFFLMLIIPVVVMPKYMLAGVQSPWRIVLRATLVITAAIMVVFMVAASTGEGVYSQAQSVVGMMSEQSAANTQLSEALGFSETSEEERIDFFTQIYNRGLQQMPVTFMFLGAVTAYLEYLLLSRLLAKRANVKKMPGFREFSFPHGTAMAVMLMYLVAWLMSAAETESGKMLYLNINMLFDLIFSLQGISVVLMFFYLKRLPHAAGIAVAAVMWVTAIGKMVLVLLGLTDMMMGVKARIRGRNAGKS